MSIAQSNNATAQISRINKPFNTTIYFQLDYIVSSLDGQDVTTAFTKVASGIAKNTPQNPHKPQKLRPR